MWAKRVNTAFLFRLHYSFLTDSGRAKFKELITLAIYHLIQVNVDSSVFSTTWTHRYPVSSYSSDLEKMITFGILFLLEFNVNWHFSNIYIISHPFTIHFMLRIFGNFDFCHLKWMCFVVKTIIKKPQYCNYFALAHVLSSSVLWASQHSFRGC